MESQANKLERAGGTLNDKQKTDLKNAGDEAKGTKIGRALRVLLGREAKSRKTDPIVENKSKNENNNLVRPL